MTYILSTQVRNPGGKKTPQDSEDSSHSSTPIRLEPIKETDCEAWLQSATVHQSQSALINLVCVR
jgi:hypothetical protein